MMINENLMKHVRIVFSENKYHSNLFLQPES